MMQFFILFCFIASMNVSVNNDSKTKRMIEGTIGVVAGYATYSYTNKYAKKPYNKYLLSQLEKLSHNESLQYASAAKKTLTNAGLDKKGVRIVDLRANNFNKIKDEVIEELKEKTSEKPTKKKINKPRSNKNKVIKKLDDILTKITKKNNKKLEEALKSISKGENACYLPALKKVYVNPDKMGFSIFHELGHSINDTSKGLKGALSKSRHFVALLAPVFLFTSIIKRKKSPDEKPKSNWDKFTTFIKNNCGKLMFLAMTPTILEEGLASINGAKIAKDVLNTDMLKKMNKMNFKAFCSYIIGALAMALCGTIAIWVKDRVAQPELANK